MMDQQDVPVAGWIGDEKFGFGDQPIFCYRFSQQPVFIAWKTVVWREGDGKRIGIKDLQWITISPNERYYPWTAAPPSEEI